MITPSTHLRPAGLSAGGLGARDHEVFAVLFLDNRHRLIEYVELFRGTIDAASVYPREIVKAALLRNAAAVTLVHNHPSGKVEPSREDRAVTTRVVEAGETIGIEVLDHVIIGETPFPSKSTGSYRKTVGSR